MHSLRVDNLNLIKLVKQNPILWDRTELKYRNISKTRAAWDHIFRQLIPGYESIDEDNRDYCEKVLVKRWTYIRDNYQKSIRKIRCAKRRGLDYKNIKPYVYTKQLDFLRKTIVIKGESGDSDEESMDTENEEETNEDTASSPVNQAVEEPTPEASTSQTPKEKKTLPKIPPKSTKTTNFNDSFKPFQTQEKTQENTQDPVISRHMSFFNGIFPTLATFNDDEVIEFQFGVLKLIKNIKNSRPSNQLNLAIDPLSSRSFTQDSLNINSSTDMLRIAKTQPLSPGSDSSII